MKCVIDSFLSFQNVLLFRSILANDTTAIEIYRRKKNRGNASYALYDWSHTGRINTGIIVVPWFVVRLHKTNSFYKYKVHDIDSQVGDGKTIDIVNCILNIFSYQYHCWCVDSM